MPKWLVGTLIAVVVLVAGGFFYFGIFAPPTAEADLEEVQQSQPAPSAPARVPGM
ncbi:MAG: hypothetical protein ACOCX1_00770 [Fimbriimonadaceae bacterium]